MIDQQSQSWSTGSAFLVSRCSSEFFWSWLSMPSHLSILLVWLLQRIFLCLMIDLFIAPQTEKGKKCGGKWEVLQDLTKFLFGWLARLEACWLVTALGSARNLKHPTNRGGMWRAVSSVLPSCVKCLFLSHHLTAAPQVHLQYAFFHLQAHHRDWARRHVCLLPTIQRYYALGQASLHINALYGLYSTAQKSCNMQRQINVST